MKLRTGIISAVFVLSIFVFGAATANAQDGIAVGSKTESFTMTGTDGKEYSLDSLKGKNGSLVIFLSAQCPVVKGYIKRIDAIAADYKAKGINFIGVNSNSRSKESLEWVTSDAEKNFKFPMLIDTDNKLADKYGANVTPEVFYFDANNVLKYRGAIDNDKSGENIQEHYLKNAFDAGLSGNAVEMTRTKAVGCSIKRVQDSE